MTLTGTHTHATLGTFSFTAEYTTRRPHDRWLVDWSATAAGAGRVLPFSGSNMVIVIGSSDAARPEVEKLIRKEIDDLT
jgi:hypothetical protein